MFGLRLVSEAIGQLGFPGVVAGEATRVTLLGSEIPLASRVLSVTLDRGLFIACGAIVTVCGITAGLLLLSLSNALRLYTALFAIGFLGILVYSGIGGEKTMAAAFRAGIALSVACHGSDHGSKVRNP